MAARKKRKKRNVSRCTKIQKMIPLYLGKGELNADELRIVDEHTDDCDECREQLYFWQKFLTFYRVRFATDPQMHPPIQQYADYLSKRMAEERFWSAIVEMILNQEKSSPRRGYA